MRTFLLLGLAVVWLGLIGCRGPGAPSDRPDETPVPELRLASDVWPPFTDVPGKSRVAIELVQTALLRTGTPVQSAIEEEFSQVMRKIQSGELDGSAALWRTPERETFLLYSRPYLENRLVLVGRKGADLSARNLADLVGKSVAVVEGYAYGDARIDLALPQFVSGPSVGANLQKLVAGEVEYVLADELLVHHLFDVHREKANRLLEAGRNAIVRRSLHFAVRKDVPDAEGVIERFDAQIGHMIVSGAYHRILDLDWIRADIDGDGQAELVAGSDRAGTAAPGRSYELFESETPGRSPRYVIDGKAYDGWNSVPPRYKVPIDSSTESTRQEFQIFDF